MKHGVKKIIVRTIKLVFWGLILQGGYSHAPDDLQYGVDMKHIRWCGILQVLFNKNILFSSYHFKLHTFIIIYNSITKRFLNILGPTKIRVNFLIICFKTNLCFQSCNTIHAFEVVILFLNFHKRFQNYFWSKNLLKFSKQIKTWSGVAAT